MSSREDTSARRASVAIPRAVLHFGPEMTGRLLASAATLATLGVLASCNVVLGLDDLQPRPASDAATGTDAGGDGGPNWLPAFSLATATERPSALAIDDTRAYWIAGSPTPSIFTIPLTRGKATTVATGDATSRLLAADGKLVYWNSGGGIYGAPPVGGQPTMLTPATGPIDSFTVDATTIYFVSGGFLRRKEGTATVQDLSTVASPATLATDPASVFGNVCLRDANGSVRSFSSTGTNTISPQEPTTGPLVADGSRCFWVSKGLNGFRYGDVNETATVDVPQTGVVGLAVRKGIAYTTSPTEGTVYATYGETSVLVATNQGRPSLVVANDSAVVWLNEKMNEIMIASRINP